MNAHAHGKPILLVLALAMILSTGLGCGDERTSLVIYSPHGRDLLELLEDAFEAKHPHVDVQWLDMGSQEVYDRVRSEAANPQADVWFGGPAQIFARGAEEGLLEPYRPAWVAAVSTEFRHPEDLYFGAYRTAPVLVYNTAEVSEEEAPRDWDALLDPRWDDEILIRDPLASGTMRTMFSMIVARSVKETGSPEQGFEWLRRLDAQTRQYIQNPALMMEKLIRGEGLITVWELTDMLLQHQRGRPLGFHFPESGTPVIADSIGLVAGASNPKVARDYIDFVGSREAQELAARKALRLPARNDLPPEKLPQWAREVMRDLIPAKVDWDLIAENGDDWMRTWNRQIRGHGETE